MKLIRHEFKENTSSMSEIAAPTSPLRHTGKLLLLSLLFVHIYQDTAI